MEWNYFKEKFDYWSWTIIAIIPLLSRSQALYGILGLPSNKILICYSLKHSHVLLIHSINPEKDRLIAMSSIIREMVETMVNYHLRVYPRSNNLISDR